VLNFDVCHKVGEAFEVLDVPEDPPGGGEEPPSLVEGDGQATMGEGLRVPRRKTPPLPVEVGHDHDGLRIYQPRFGPLGGGDADDASCVSDISHRADISRPLDEDYPAVGAQPVQLRDELPQELCEFGELPLGSLPILNLHDGPSVRGGEKRCLATTRAVYSPRCARSLTSERQRYPEVRGSGIRGDTTAVTTASDNLDVARL